MVLTAILALLTLDSAHMSSELVETFECGVIASRTEQYLDFKSLVVLALLFELEAVLLIGVSS